MTQVYCGECLMARDETMPLMNGVCPKCGLVYTAGQMAFAAAQGEIESDLERARRG